MNQYVKVLPTIKLGEQKSEVAIQGLGCMGLSEFYGPVLEKDIAEVMEAAIESGINMFDTADMYGLGENEKLLGRWINRYRDKMFVCTKFGYTRTVNQPDNWSVSNRPEYIRQAVEGSLTRLGVESIDLYYMHRRDPHVPLEDSVGTLADLIKEGKIRSIGLSAVTAEELRTANAIHSIAALQSEWSLFSRDIESGVIPAAAELGIPLVSYAPLGRGLLTNKLASEALAADDARRHFPRFSPENIAANNDIMDNVARIASERRISAAQLSLAWLYTKAEELQVSVIPIPGTKRKHRLHENISAISLRLSESEMTSLDVFAGRVKGISI